MDLNKHLFTTFICSTTVFGSIAFRLNSQQTLGEVFHNLLTILLTILPVAPDRIGIIQSLWPSMLGHTFTAQSSQVFNSGLGVVTGHSNTFNVFFKSFVLQFWRFGLVHCPVQRPNLTLLSDFFPG